MDINSMSKDELKDYAETLDVKFTARDSVQELRNKIAIKTGDIVVDTAEEVAAEMAGKSGEEYVNVIFNVGDDGDTTDVYASINGENFRAKRNEEVRIKRKFLTMLQNECVGFKVVQSVDSNGNVTTKQIKKPTYTFQILG